MSSSDEARGEPPDILNGHTLPFIVFIALTALTPLVPGGVFVIYPLKTVLAAGMLWYFRRDYSELSKWHFHWLALPVGLLVTLLWVGMDGFYPKTAVAEGFNPFTTGAPGLDWLGAGIRLGGSTLVVPVMEELFWRSWLLRFLIDRDDFRRVPVGRFSGFGFCVSILLFGLEHDRWLAGILAGAIYAALVYWRKEIRTAIVAHAVTNFALGLYVIAARAWTFW
ncbi:CAAX prenyl protease-related protein [Gloeobacter kilaueensis]|uniref:CAAX amino terminal protease family protein n=1 Tax=Gloeobacter kilaueensis (strain ATCC BAA-2537 / CCAP 1431/1 / ULC 316 / JS1) TaxID=1183438 RepID=U5QHD6_GLOK1|nr:CAAX prenyl protease-related protein [Gloeobacter kilaueensis]AGY58372.1 CAAX amino terminal protease family protein [Gloeobacter kilaueensis JS1]